MKKFLVKKARFESATTSDLPVQTQEINSCVLDENSLEADPGLRQKISSFHPNVQDEVRRGYLQRGSCQPRNHTFPFTNICGRNRRFNPAWFDEFDWLEYSNQKNAAYCLKCYLFRNDNGKKGGGETFFGDGFTYWNKKDRLYMHVGKSVNSEHNIASRKCADLMKHAQSIGAAFCKQSNQMKKDYRIRLEASVDCITWLLHNGLALHGHDESESSTRKGIT
ncbi:hypothetical protein LINPERHAP2_LOCUS16517 [Linum perenne]